MLARRGFLKLATLVGLGVAVPRFFVVVEQAQMPPPDSTLLQIHAWFDKWLAAQSEKPTFLLFFSEDAYRHLRDYYAEEVLLRAATEPQNNRLYVVDLPGPGGAND